MIYLLLGDDEFAIEQAVKQLQAKFEIADLAFTRARSPNADQLNQALISACTWTLDLALQMVWIQGCKAAIEKGDLQPYWEVIASEDSPTVLALSCESLDGRLKSVKALKQIATVEDYQQISIWQTHELVTNAHKVCRSAGLELGGQEVEAIVECVGNDSRLLHRAIEVLSLYGSGGKPVTIEVIQSLVPSSMTNGLEFAKALFRRDCNGALEHLEQWLSLGESPLPLIATVAGQLRLWVGVKAAIARNSRLSNEEIARMIRLGGSPGRVYYLRQEVAAIRLESLVALMKMVVATECAIKTGSDPKLVLRRLALAAGRGV